MELFFFLAKFLVLLLLAVNLGEQLQRARFLGPELENILQSFAGVRVGVVVDVLPGQAIPVVDLAFAAPVFNFALQRQRGGVVGFDLQGFLQFLQRERIFLFFKTRPRGIEQLRKRFAPDRAVELAAQRADGGIHVAFGFEFAENFSGKLKVAFFQSFGGALQARPSALGIEKSMGSLRSALLSVSPKSRALAKRCQDCFAIALCSTRLTGWLTVEFSSAASGGMWWRIASTTSSARARWNGLRPVIAS